MPSFVSEFTTRAGETIFIVWHKAKAFSISHLIGPGEHSLYIIYRRPVVLLNLPLLIGQVKIFLSFHETQICE